MQISAKIIAHSKSSVNDKEIITWELEYPRFIHSELLTHRLFSRNAASSRAIPVAKMIEMVRDNPAMPIHWGKNQPGMQAKEELIGGDLVAAQCDWQAAANAAASVANRMVEVGVHKQITNRILEPFQWMKTVVTATEFDNWFWLRNHPDAQPEIKRLAEVMWEALQSSVPKELEPGMWHMPYYGEGYWGCLCNDSLEDALAISSSCCAQVSYRKLDDSLGKAKDIFAKLIESKPCHASPTEHQATPMDYTNKYDCTDDGVNVARFPWSWEEGITHADRNGKFWSGNFCGWIQHRQLIPDNACWNYVPNEAKE